MMENKIKVITGKIGLDDHYRGIVSVTEALRDAGMEVVYLGSGQRVEGVIEAVVQEDANVLGLSFHGGAHLEIMRKLMNQMQNRSLDDVLVIVGGTIHLHDAPKLKEMGVSGVFFPGTPLKDIVDFVSKNVKKHSKTKV